MAYLFDTDAISNLLRPRPAPAFLRWLATVDRAEQYTSAVVVGELFKGAFRSQARNRHLANIDQKILPRMTVLPYDTSIARIFGEIRAELEREGRLLADADLQIGATALYHGLTVVTGNLKHFSRIPGLVIADIFARARRES